MKILKSQDEIKCLADLCWQTREVIGEIAEIGVYEGGSLAIIREFANGKIIHGFDTFEGFIEEQILEGEAYKKGELKSDYGKIYKEFERFDNIKLHKGDILQTMKEVEDRQFSFIHLDIDIYKPTKECLEFFYPRLSQGGIVLIDDYCPTNWGVIKAVNEFIAEHNLELKRGVSRLAYIKK